MAGFQEPLCDVKTDIVLFICTASENQWLVEFPFIASIKV